jgi:hypothetical protein
MTGLGKTALTLLMAVGLAAAGPPPANVAQLGWLAGAWVEEKHGAWTEERWALPRGGVMLGASLSGKGDRADDFEFTRIAADADGAIHYWASVKGAPAVPFRLVSASTNQAVFENPRHDYPTRISYRRVGNMLMAEISGPGGAHPMRWRYTRR